MLQAVLVRTEKAAQGFCFMVGSEFKRAETKLREKHAAESGWKQDVSNRPLSRSDLGGVPTERRAFRVSFVRAAYSATGVKQNPGEPAFRLSFKGEKLCKKTFKNNVRFKQAKTSL